MATFAEQIRIDAPVSEVWELLADLGTIWRWIPSVTSSHVTTEQSQGLGTGRRCRLVGRGYLDEEVVEWEEKKRLTVRIVATNLPFKRADIRFSLESEGDATLVTLSPVYDLKLGWVGRLADALFVRHRYVRAMRAVLEGLKQAVESHAQGAATSSP